MQADGKAGADNSTRDRILMWVYAIAYSAATGALFVYSLMVIKHPIFIVVTGLFAAFGPLYLWLVLRDTLSNAKFGKLELILEKPAPAIGGRLTGLVPLPPALLKAKSVSATLTCHSVTVVFERGGQELLPNAVWSETAELGVVPTGRGCVVKISMAIPDGQQATRMPDASVAPKPGAARSGYFNWDLTLTADVPGIDLDITFPVIVISAQEGAAPAAEMPAARPREAVADAPKQAAPAAAPAGAPAGAFTLALLVAVNLLPIAGVAFWGWRVHEVVFLYWAENLVIGAANVLRMSTAAPAGEAAAGVVAKLIVIAFFLVHYGVFCYGHGIALVALFPVAADGVRPGSPFDVLGRMLEDPHVLAALGAIAVSHGYSYFRNYIGRGEYLRVKLGELMTRPYKRIAVTQVFLLAGGFALQSLDSPLLAIVVFIAIKIGFDAYYHRREHVRR